MEGVTMKSIKYDKEEFQDLVNSVTPLQAVEWLLMNGYPIQVRNLGKSTVDGVYENETEATEQSIQLLQETLDNVTAMQPSVGKEDDRLSLITAMQTALDHMKEYKESVESGETDLTNYSHIFETDINVLTGMASLYNQ